MIRPFQLSRAGAPLKKIKARTPMLALKCIWVYDAKWFMVLNEKNSLKCIYYLSFARYFAFLRPQLQQIAFYCFYVHRYETYRIAFYITFESFIKEKSRISAFSMTTRVFHTHVFHDYPRFP